MREKGGERINSSPRGMGSGKHIWKTFFYRSSPNTLKPPKEFICPVSNSLMADPVIVSSGHTFERNSVQACRNLGFKPTLSDGSVPDFSTVIQNIAIKFTILNWCDKFSIDCPKPLPLDDAENLVRTLMANSDESISELADDSDSNYMKLTHAETELTQRPTHFYSSSDDSLLTTPLQLATRPSFCSSPSSSEIEIVNPNSTEEEEEEEDIIVKLKSPQVFEQEEAVISLRNITRTNEESRVSLCTPRLLSALRSLIASRYAAVQINSVAALVNLSLEKTNKVKIVRAGIVPSLIDVLKGGSPESQEHAAGAFFSLAVDDNNKTAIGALGALPPLLHLLRSSSERTRHDAAMALYHLSLVQSNRSKLVKLGSVQTLLGLVRSGDLMGRVLLVLCNLGTCKEGRVAMLDAGAVGVFVDMLRDDELNSTGTLENCIAALYSLSHCGLRFKGLAKEAQAMEVLNKIERTGTERARVKAKRILQVMKERNQQEEVEINWEKVLDLGFSRARTQIL